MELVGRVRRQIKETDFEYTYLSNPNSSLFNMGLTQKSVNNPKK